MTQICKMLGKKFACRYEVISIVHQLIGNPEEKFPPAIYLYGHTGTGKTAIMKQFLYHMNKTYWGRIRTVYLNCVECYTTKILLESILDNLIGSGDNLCSKQQNRCENFDAFITELCSVHNDSKYNNNGFIIILDNSDRVRDMDDNVLPCVLRLQELSGLNICTILISQLPFEKYYCKSGLPEILKIYFPQYSKTETLQILRDDFENAKKLIYAKNLKESNREKLVLLEEISPEFYNNYLNIFLSVFYKGCRDVPELTITARKCFSIYMEPILNGSVKPNNVSKLWSHIAVPLKNALSQVYMRMDYSPSQQNEMDQSTRKLAQSLELPYYGKFLLIAAYLASYNSAKEDKRLFIKNHGKQKKRMQLISAKAKVTEKMSTSLGPKPFSIDRLLAIFYAILEEKVGLTCNLLSQISTLLHLKLLSFVSGESNIMDGSSRLQCTVSLEFVLYIGNVIGFNVRQYLCDF